jgi:hypothetical protein
MGAAIERAPRFRVKGFTVVYDTGDGLWSGPVTDISNSGLFVETAHKLPIGTPVTLFPQFEDEKQLPFEIRALVARVKDVNLDSSLVEEEGIAFKLEGLSEQQVIDLQAFLGAHGIAVR